MYEGAISRHIAIASVVAGINFVSSLSRLSVLTASISISIYLIFIIIIINEPCLATFLPKMQPYALSFTSFLVVFILFFD